MSWTLMEFSIYMHISREKSKTILLVISFIVFAFGFVALKESERVRLVIYIQLNYILEHSLAFYTCHILSSTQKYTVQMTNENNKK